MIKIHYENLGLSSATVTHKLYAIQQISSKFSASFASLLP